MGASLRSLTVLQAFKPHGLPLDVLVAFSAFGNLIAVVYTSAKGRPCATSTRTSR